jgi:D-tagatose-1,6-bisphosphate aldolase subunit GatZ/KbaZ
MTPPEFVEFVGGVARDVGFPREKVLLGGDHLGPNAWQGKPADEAMGHARELVRRYVDAGYTKIHLDASMRCADDPGDEHTPLPDEVVSERAADLCEQCERAYANLSPGSPAPVYVIGTEVPPPGGMKAGEDSIRATDPDAAEKTIQVTKEAFQKRGLEEAWERVIATVVQPGVDFGDATVVDYDPTKAKELVTRIESYETLVYEAHSTDYQRADSLRSLVKDHFAILKVGPWLTFALREAVLALEQIEQTWLSGGRGIELSRVMEALEEVMVTEPVYWRKHYQGDEEYLKYARTFSYSDRIRYYWPRPEVDGALTRLLANLSKHPIPLPLLNQYLPGQYDAVRNGEIANNPVDLIHHRIREVTQRYAEACGKGSIKGSRQ